MGDNKRLAALFRAEVLKSEWFIPTFEAQLTSLMCDEGFMALMKSIRESGPTESPDTIANIKRLASRKMFESQATFKYAPLNHIVDGVTGRGWSKSSAFISVYCEIRARELESAKTPACSAVQSQTSTQVASQSLSLKNALNEKDFRLKWKAQYRCEDGHYVRSKNEVLVDNWLFNHGICHAYEKAVFSAVSDTTYCSDFYIPELRLFIEVWGMVDDAYRAHAQKKREFYQSNGYDLLEIDGSDVMVLDDTLSKAFRRKLKAK